MADPVKRPLQWDKKYNTYADKHGIYDVFQETLKELAIWKPEDPLAFLRDEICRIAKGINTPRVFMIGPEIMTTFVASRIAGHTGAKFLTLEIIIRETASEIQDHLLGFLEGRDTDNEELRKLLIAIISRRVSMDDCMENGYVLYGFPQSRAQAILAQSCGLIPRKVLILLPEGPPEPEAKLTAPSVTNANETHPQGTNPIPSAKPSKAGGISTAINSKYPSRMSMTNLETYKEFFTIKDIATIFNPENVKSVTFDHWNTTEPGDLESEFLGAIITKKYQGAPWIPKILFIGPPGSGKRTVAEFLGKKYGINVVSWIEMVRGNANIIDDPVGEECKQYLEDFTPMSHETIGTLLKRRLYEDNCMKKGWILFGFPETLMDCKVLDDLALTPNRIFLLSCPEPICLTRLDKKKRKILRRVAPELPEFTEKASKFSLKENKKETFAQNPYSDEVLKDRMHYFNDNVDDVINHYGSEIIYVDGTQELQVIKEYVLNATIKPPNVRF